MQIVNLSEKREANLVCNWKMISSEKRTESPENF